MDQRSPSPAPPVVHHHSQSPDLFVPIAIWNGAPSHSVTCLVVSPNKTKIATSSKEGNIFLWNLNYYKDLTQEEAEEDANSNAPPPIEPYFVLLRPKSNSPITYLAAVTYNQIPGFVSVSIDGSLCIWSFADGSCLASADKLLLCKPTTLSVLPNGKHLACAGQSCDIEIVNMKKMKVVNILSAHTNWVKTLYSVDLRSGSVYCPVLVSGAIDGVINFWSLKKGENQHPWETICIEKGEPISVALSPNFKAVLIATRQRLMLYAAKDPHELAHVPAPAGGWNGAAFVGQRIIVAWTTEGIGYLYAVPRMDKAEPLSFSLHEKGESPVARDPPPTDDEVIYESPKQTQMNFRMSYLSKLNLVEKGGTPALAPLCTFLSSSNILEGQAALSSNFVGGAWGRLFVLGNELGKLTAWMIPARPSKNETQIQIRPWASVSASDPWNMITANDKEKDKRSPVTATLIIEDLMLLVLGYENGSLSINPLPTGPNLSVMPQAHNGVVSSLLAITKDSRRYLISGSSDFSIKVWLIRERSFLEFVWKFDHHTGPITHLIMPPTTHLTQPISSSWRNNFFSVSEDKTIGLFSIENMNNKHVFGVHSSPIAKVKWDSEQDYLFVQCDDGSVSIWEIGTGQQEGRVFGANAYEIMSNAPVSLFPESDEREKDHIMHKKALAANTLCSTSRDPPIQILYLNIRHLIHDLVAHVKPHDNPASPRAALSSSTGSLGPNSLHHSKEHHHTPTTEELLSHLPPSAKSAFLSYTYLLPWGVDEEMDQMMKTKLFLQPPGFEATYAIKGHSGNLSLIVPSKLSRIRRWLLSPNLTALHNISAVAFTSTLMGLEGLKNVCSQILTQLCTIQPETLPGYVEPSLDFLVLFWRDHIDDVMQAARSILIASANRLTPDQRKSFAQTWAIRLREALATSVEVAPPVKEREPFQTFNKRISINLPNIVQTHHRPPIADTQAPVQNRDVSLPASPSAPQNSMKGLALIVLGILGTQFPDCLDKDLTSQVTVELLKLLNDENEAYSLRVSAAELLGRGFSMWRNNIKDVDNLIQQLFSLSLVSKPANIRGTAHQALMLIGSAEPKQFVISLGQYILEVHYADNLTGKPANVSQHSAAIMTLGSLIKQDPVALLPTLPRLVETIVRSLDPHVPYLRDKCLEATTKVLHALVKQYPMVSFHQESQRLAVGTKDAAIVIYDLKTATRWHVLEGHKSALTAVAFAYSGKMLASYSLEDAEVRFWATTSSFFGILGSAPHCLRVIQVNPVNKTLSPTNLLENVRLKWSTPNTVALIRTWEGSLTLKL